MSDEGRDYVLFLEDIVEAIGKIEIYSGDLSLDEFRANAMAVDAVIRNFEIIGEAAKNIPVKVKEKYPNVEWKEAAGFRDVLIHAYFGIDVEAVWDTIKNNVPMFKLHVSHALQSEKQERVQPA
ncbi:DUF86 domain-containing protein [Patescibacteria group bacterium]|nr:DUF86 domain-containing protein [Pseudomonadota bacterium]MBU2233980.1 DUF86 domain-containing protein [Patescibacteria group bacterium]